MAKKKNSRQKHQKDVGDPNSSEEEGHFQNSRGCPHASKAINIGKVKRSLKTNTDIEKCVGCLKKPPNTSAAVCDNKIGSDEVWLCLQCGYCGCGRNAPSQHAILHQKTPRSDCHSIVLNTTTMCVWCYECDDEVLHSTSRIIRECVDFIRKFKTSIRTNLCVNGSIKETCEKGSIVKENTFSRVALLKPEGSTLATKQKSLITESHSVVNCSKKSDLSKTRLSIKGLRNLGNTCFFNAVMQNLSQTPCLLNELEMRADKNFIWEVPFPVDGDEQNACGTEEEIRPLRVTLSEYFPLMQSLMSFLKQMNSNSSQSNKGEVVNPGTLFEQICKKSPQFRGFQQQDSHELLRHLLDGVRNEEIRRQKKGILKALNFGDKIDTKNVDDDTKLLIKAYGSHASHTLVDKIFGGQLLSTVLCEECKMSSQVFEPFMDLSLPLAEEKPIRTGKVVKRESSEPFCLHVASKVNASDGKPSKYQEKKIKQQARKSAKRQAKVSRMKRNNSYSANEEIADDNEVLKVSMDSKSVLNNELSDADIEDNEDSESVSGKFANHGHMMGDSVTSVNEGNNVSRDYITPLDDRIQELCSQITDVRIRRDSDNQENFLESLESRVSFHKSQETVVHEDISENSVNGPECFNWAHSQPEQLKKEWMLRSLTTLQPRYQPSSHECSVNSCLNQFTASELLTGSNKFRCENCTILKQEGTGNKSEVVYSNASKQLLIFSPPAVLTLHLKRFQQTGMSLRKLNLFVEFPFILDLAPYCSSVSLRLPHMVGVKDEILYSLYGIVQHSGRLTSGHYTAFVKVNKGLLNPAFLNSWPMGHCSLDQLLEKIRKVKTHSYYSQVHNVNETKPQWYYVSDGHFNEVSESEVLKCQAYILFYERIK